MKGRIEVHWLFDDTGNRAGKQRERGPVVAVDVDDTARDP
jgi:hypothetical protein